MQSKTKMSPYDSVLTKVYLVNLLSEQKYINLYSARLVRNRIALIVNKLTGDEVKTLIDRIENIL